MVALTVGAVWYGFDWGRGYGPDLLWAYGFTVLVGLPWRRRLASFEARAWVVAPLLLGTLGEALQGAEWIPGTGDPLDVVCYILGSAVATHRLHHVRP